MCRIPLDKAFESIVDQGPILEVGGERYREVAPTSGRAMTLYGPAEFARSGYRSSSGPGESDVPKEITLGLAESSLTPATAHFSMMLLSCLTARESADILKLVSGKGL